MKANISEYEGCYGISLEAENMEEAAMITRLGINSLKELRSCNAYASKGGFTASIVIGKSKKASSLIPKTK